MQKTAATGPESKRPESKGAGEQTMECPQCGYEMKVTESLAAPLIACGGAEVPAADAGAAGVHRRPRAGGGEPLRRTGKTGRRC